MYELTNLLTTIAQCSATVIAIVGGFIASKLIAISTEREEIIARISEINSEINYKSQKSSDAKRELDEDDAIDFIKENIIDFISGKSLEEVYKKEERPNLSEEELSPYWNKAVEISKKHFDIIAEMEEVNDDGVPNILAREIESDFEYAVCKYTAKGIEKIRRSQERKTGIHFVDDLPLITPRINTWYQKKRSEMNEANAFVEWLEIQKNELLVRKDTLKKPKGMKDGLIVFGLYSLLGVIIPLLFVPFSTESYRYYLSVKISMISIFTVGLIAVFIYLINLLKWKE